MFRVASSAAVRSSRDPSLHHHTTSLDLIDTSASTAGNARALSKQFYVVACLSRDRSVDVQHGFER